jgi:hypothetical protein
VAAGVTQVEADNTRFALGKKFAWSGIKNSFHVSECFDEEVVSIATTGDATIMLYEDGASSWTAGLTDNLYNKLKGRQDTLPSPTYVAMGSGGRYYIEFADGKSEWVGPKAICKYLQNPEAFGVHSRDGVRSVAFGADFDTYFIVYNGGYWNHGGGIPTGLVDLLERRECAADLDHVSLGPGGEWYLAATNGRAWWGGVPDDFGEFIKDVKNSIEFVDFGEGGSYIIRYN